MNFNASESSPSQKRAGSESEEGRSKSGKKNLYSYETSKTARPSKERQRQSRQRFYICWGVYEPPMSLPLALKRLKNTHPTLKRQKSLKSTARLPDPTPGSEKWPWDLAAQIRQFRSGSSTSTSLDLYPLSLSPLPCFVRFRRSQMRACLSQTESNAGM